MANDMAGNRTWGIAEYYKSMAINQKWVWLEIRS